MRDTTQKYYVVGFKTALNIDAKTEAEALQVVKHLQDTIMFFLTENNIEQHHLKIFNIQAKQL